LGLSRLVLAGILAALISLIAREKLAPHFVILGVSTLTGMLSAARTAVSMASAPAAGLISDALKDRWSALAASLGFGCVGLSLLALDSPLPLILGLLLCAVPAGGVAVLTRILVGELSHRSIQGRAMGIVQTVGDLGSAIGPPLAFLVLPAAGLALIFRLSSAAFALNLLVILLMRRGLIARAGRFAG
jgi:MFS family permease